MNTIAATVKTIIQILFRKSKRVRAGEISAKTSVSNPSATLDRKDGSTVVTHPYPDRVK